MTHKTDMQAVLLDAMRVISENADEIKAGCAIDDEWPDAEDKAEYDRRVSVLERVRALADQSAGVAEPIYQTRWGSPETVWGDVEKAAYDDFESFGYAARRIVYAAAPAPVSAPSPDREQGGEAQKQPHDRVALVQTLMLDWVNSKPGDEAKAVWTRIEERLVEMLGDASPSRECGERQLLTDLRDAIARYWEFDTGKAQGLITRIERALAASAPTLGGGAAPWQGCKHRVCYKNGACWTAGKCLEPTEPEPRPTEIDAQIKACALMILGICATRPQDEWPKRIEGRIRYMLSRLQPQAAEPKGMTDEQIEKAALDFVKKPGMQGYVEPGDLIDFARALLSKGVWHAD